jgi:hypothetical protein
MASLSPITPIKVSNLREYVANFIELSDGAMGLIQGSLQGQPLQFVVPGLTEITNLPTPWPMVSPTQVQMPILLLSFQVLNPY